MSSTIAPQVVPSWAVESLGKRVRLLDDLRELSDVYPAGKLATLDAIFHGPYALVFFDEDETNFVNAPFHILEPAE
jgi:hypothetical protein